MGRAMFDDITPPSQGGSPQPTGNAATPPPVRKPEDRASGDFDTSNTDEEHHSIRNVAPVQTHDRETRRARRAERRKLAPSVHDSSGRRRPSFGKFGVWALVLVVLAIALSAVGFVFIGKTTISIVPLQETITLSASAVHTAYRQPEDTELGYSLTTHSIEATQSIPATGRETVEEKASGKIVVYNTHSEAPQRLIKNTRFEAPNGEIYRVRNSFSVPGMTGSTPGSIEVVVHADTAGATQNISALGTRFTIPGLKGDPRFDTFYAELSEPITGGFVGERAIVDEATLTAARTQLQTELRGKTTDALFSQLAEDLVVFESGIFVTFESSPTQYADDETAQVKEVARITAIAFDENELARMLATAALATTEEGDITIDSKDALTFTVVEKDTIDIASDPLIQFTLEGSTTLTWSIDTESLKQDLVGKHSGALNTVMSGYPGIKSAQATIRPFWKSEFPSESDSITIEMLPEK